MTEERPNCGRIKTQCLQCEKILVIIPSRFYRAKHHFCSQGCTNQWRKLHRQTSNDRHKRIEKRCEICNSLYNGLVKQRVCSRNCQHKLHSLQIQARGKSRKVSTGNGYIRIYMPSHHRAAKDGYVLEHILVWEQAYNIRLPLGWVIHHKNHLKADNRPENLEALPRSEHNSNRMFQELQQIIENQGLAIKLLKQEIRLHTWQIKELNKKLNEITQERMDIH